MTKRIMRRVVAGDKHRCRCGLRAAYIVELTYEGTNRFDLPQEMTRTISFCTSHGKRYAAQFRLEVKE